MSIPNADDIYFSDSDFDIEESLKHDENEERNASLGSKQQLQEEEDWDMEQLHSEEESHRFEHNHGLAAEYLCSEYLHLSAVRQSVHRLYDQILLTTQLTQTLRQMYARQQDTNAKK